MDKIKSFLDYLNTRTRKGKMITLLSVLSLFLITTIIVISMFYIDMQSKNSAFLFEKAYDELLEFNDLNLISKVEMRDKLITLLDEVCEKYPNTSSGKRALYYQGHVEYFTGNFEEAEKKFELFLKKNPNFYLSSKAKYLLSYTKSNLNKVEEAIDILKYFDKKKDDYYTPLAFYRLGNLYEKKGDKELALQYYEKIIKDFSQSPQKEKAETKMVTLKNDLFL
ncbi:MAG: tetratricopeptide repeat protein [Spirochaetes bacterium]|nr:tetratricopeptide repeat protein [Spirochaetota bacterium]